MESKKESSISSKFPSPSGKTIWFQGLGTNSVILCSTFLSLNSTLWVILPFSWKAAYLISLFLACKVLGVQQPCFVLFSLFSLLFSPSWQYFWDGKRNQLKIYTKSFVARNWLTYCGGWLSKCKSVGQATEKGRLELSGCNCHAQVKTSILLLKPSPDQVKPILDNSNWCGLQSHLQNAFTATSRSVLMITSDWFSQVDTSRNYPKD